MRNCAIFHGRVLLVLLVAIVTLCDVLGAQEAVSIPAGPRVRVSAPDLKEQLPHPGLWIVQLEKENTRTALNSIDMLEKDSGRGENAAMVGALVGMAAGGTFGYLAGKDDCRRTDYQCMTRRSGAVVFGLGGLVLGAGIGALMVNEWVPVSPPTRVSLRREAGGNFEVAASRRF
jgi:hypothetical protein